MSLSQIFSRRVRFFTTCNTGKPSNLRIPAWRNFIAWILWVRRPWIRLFVFWYFGNWPHRSKRLSFLIGISATFLMVFFCREVKELRSINFQFILISSCIFQELQQIFRFRPFFDKTILIRRSWAFYSILLKNFTVSLSFWAKDARPALNSNFCLIKRLESFKLSSNKVLSPIDSHCKLFLT